MCEYIFCRYWWIGLPFATFHINSTVNTGTKVSPFQFVFGHEGGTRGVGELQLKRDVMKSLETESDLNLHLNLANGQMLEWVGRPSPPVETIEPYQYCQPVRRGENLVLNQVDADDVDNVNEASGTNDANDNLDINVV